MGRPARTYRDRVGVGRAVFAIVVAFLFAGAAFAQETKRVALVIGNSVYEHTPSLSNPANDAEDMAATLTGLGFSVFEGRDLTKAAMDQTLREFSDALKGANIGLFFYAGHGLQVDGANYLVPTDATLSTEGALDFEMVRLDFIQSVMERETDTNVIMLDACRDNPLAQNLARAMGTRSASIGRGLAQIEAGLGTLVSFSTQPGNVALDGVGRNSPYSGALVRHLRLDNDDLISLLIQVRNDVIAATDEEQVPWDQHALRGPVYLAGSQPDTDEATSGDRALSEAALAWASLQGSTDMRAYEAFRRQYGAANAFYDQQAAGQIERLRRGPALSAGDGPLAVFVEMARAYWRSILAALGAIAVPATAFVFHYYSQNRLRPGRDYAGDNPTAEEERAAYRTWRAELVDGGGIARIYGRLLDGALNWLDRFMGDAERVGSGKSYLTGPALDRCLLMALLYPIVTVLVIWHLTGVTGPVEEALWLDDGVDRPLRAASAAASVALIASCLWLTNPPDTHRTFIWNFLRSVAFLSRARSRSRSRS